MTNEPPGSTPPGGRKRPTPTIDLTATELESRPLERSAADAASPPQNAAEPPPADPALDSEPSHASDAAEPEASQPEPPRSAWSSARDHARQFAERIPPQIPWTGFGAGLLGGLLVLLLAWLAGLSSTSTVNPSRVDTRLARIESQLQQLAQAPASSGDASRVNDLAGRVAALESAPRGRAGEPDLVNRLGAAEQVLKAQEQSIADLGRRLDEVNASLRELGQRVQASSTSLADLARRSSQQGDVGRGDLDALTGRVTAVENAERALRSDLSKQAAGASDRSARLSAAANSLVAAVERGAPFANELAAVKALGSAQNLAPLEPFAAQGLPAQAALVQELSTVTPAMTRLASAATTGEGGFLDKLQANAERLVRIRPIGDTGGDDPRSVIARAESAASRGDLAEALRELQKLPDNVRQPANDWIRKVTARQAALDASRAIATDAAGAMIKPAQ